MKTWRDEVAELEGARKRLQQYGQEMTPHERRTAEELVRDLRDQSYARITAGAVAEMEAALDGLQKAQAAVGSARQAEARRWDPQKVSGHMALVRDRVQAVISRGDNPLMGDTIVGGLREVFDDAMRGDEVAQRGACEIFRGVLGMVPAQDRQDANHLRAAAERRLTELRDTPEIGQAKVAAREAFGAAAAKKDELERISQAIDGHGVVDVFASTALTRVARRLNVDRMTGAVSVLDPNDPAVLGYEIVMPGAIETAGG